MRAEVENTFEVVAREWFAKHKDSWAPSHSEKIIARLEKDVFPLIGGKAIAAVTAPELLEALQRIEARGAIECSAKLWADISLMCAI